MNGQVNNLIEKRMMSGDPREDKLSLFRQQVNTGVYMYNVDKLRAVSTELESF